MFKVKQNVDCLSTLTLSGAYPYICIYIYIYLPIYHIEFEMHAAGGIAYIYI